MPKEESSPPITQSTFVGGSAIDPKLGINGAFFSSEGLDFRQKASQMSVLPGARQLSAGLSDLMTVMVQTPDGVRYGVGDQGYIYRISTSNVVSPVGQLTSAGGAGAVYNQQSDQLYLTSQQTVSLYGQISQSPSLRLDNFGPSASTANGTVNLFNPLTNAYDTPRNNAASATSGGITLANYSTLVNTTQAPNSYILPSVINERPVDFCPFIPDIEPFYSVAVYLTAVGTGNLTLTMHDSLNNNLGVVTISHANVVAGWNNFIFAAPGIRAIPNAFATGSAAGYHFHLTSSVAGDTAAAAVVNTGDLTGANFLLFAYRLVSTNNGWHPAVIFGQYLAIGNGPYLSVYNFSNDASPNNQQWVRHRLSLDYGYEVCGLSVNNQMLVIAAEKRSTNTSRSYQDGYLYFWDGTNVNFNSKVEVPMGSPYALSSVNNVTYFICAGSLFAYGGGQQVIKVRYIGYQNTDYLGAVDSTIVNPNMMDTRYNLLLVGYPSSTTNSNLKYGIYSWGSVELTYPNSFGYSYALSGAVANGMYYSSGNNLQIGMIKNFVDTLYTSWRYTDGNSVTHYGLDIVDNFSNPASVFNWQSLIWDGGVRWKMKRGLRTKLNFLPLPANTTLTINYTLDRGTSQTSSSASPGDTSLLLEIDTNFYELQWGFSGTSGALPAVLTGTATEIDILGQAQDVRPDDISSGTSLAGD